jgi:peptide/nickel transport system substrate-binding protein
MRLVLVIVQRRALVALCLGLLAGACGRAGGDSGRGGTIIIATAQDADILFPPTTTTNEGKAVTDLLFDRLADRGPSLNTVGDSDFVPRLAQRWEWSRDKLQVTFHLDPRARWHDGRPVRAADVRFAFSVYTDPMVSARGGGDLRAILDSISVGDSLACIAWFKRQTPEQFDQLVTTLVPLPEHLLGGIRRDSLATSAFARQPIGNGPFRFVRWEPGLRIEIAANADSYRGRPKLDRVIWTVAPEQQTLVNQLFAGEADFLETLTVEDAAAATKRTDIRVLRRGNYDNNFLRFNLRDGATDRPHPIFGDRALRRALTMALDQRAMVRSVFDTLGHVGLGPFVRAQWSADTTLAEIAFDRAAATRALDSLGWRAGADGVRTRNGRPLAFSLLVPASSKNRNRFAVLVQEQLRQVGVRVELEPLDINALGARLIARRFDAIMDGLTLTPSPSGLRQTWTSSAVANGGFNFGGFVNPAFDAQVDSAVTAGDMSSAKAHYRAAYRIIIGDAPAIWLYEPPQASGANHRLQVGTLRADAWWYGLPTWSIAPGARLPRDEMPAKSP